MITRHICILLTKPQTTTIGHLRQKLVKILPSGIRYTSRTLGLAVRSRIHKQLARDRSLSVRDPTKSESTGKSSMFVIRDT